MKIQVPGLMLYAAIEAYCNTNSLRGTKDCSDRDRVECALEAALRWLSENPIVPTDEQVGEIMRSAYGSQQTYVALGAVEWQRRMFLAPELEMPEAIRDLLSGTFPNGGYCVSEEVGKLILEAYRRGLAGSSK